jgi:hypothetical protein
VTTLSWTSKTISYEISSLYAANWGRWSTSITLHINLPCSRLDPNLQTRNLGTFELSKDISCAIHMMCSGSCFSLSLISLTCCDPSNRIYRFVLYNLGLLETATTFRMLCIDLNSSFLDRPCIHAIIYVVSGARVREACCESRPNAFIYWDFSANSLATVWFEVFGWSCRRKLQYIPKPFFLHFSMIILERVSLPRIA